MPFPAPSWAPRLSDARRRGAIAALAVLMSTLAACRADSLSAPPPEFTELCGTAPGCRTSTSAPLDTVVLIAIDDAASRLTPGIQDVTARATVASLLGKLSADLAASRIADARTHLALVYDEIDLMETAAGIRGDLPDLAAIRLGLVPTANSLGVSAR
jgi:hypothetical protein